jgi:hypothetical protein
MLVWKGYAQVSDRRTKRLKRADGRGRGIGRKEGTREGGNLMETPWVESNNDWVSFELHERDTECCCGADEYVML